MSNQYPHDPNQLPPHLRDDHVISNSPLNPNHPSSSAYVNRANGEQGPAKKPHGVRTAILATVVAVVGLFVAVGIIGAATDEPTKVVPSPVAPAATAPAADPATVPTEDTADPTPTPTKTTPKLTLSQEQAIGSAQSYLDYTSFSRKGLIRQLSSDAGEGFSVKDATFAVDYLKVDWNEQATKKAKEYLGYTHFSRSGLIHQLESSAGEGFTHSQAVYGVKQAGL